MIKYLPLLFLLIACSSGTGEQSKHFVDTTAQKVKVDSAKKIRPAHSVVEDFISFPVIDFTVNALPLKGHTTLYTSKWGKPTSKVVEADDVGCYDIEDYVVDRVTFNDITFIGVKDTLIFKHAKITNTAKFYFKGNEIKTRKNLQVLLLDKSSKKVQSWDIYTNGKKQKIETVYYRNDGFGEEMLRFIFTNDELTYVELSWECS
jgi:hypothetical protein